MLIVYDVEKSETALQDVKSWKNAVDESVDVAPIFSIVANKCDEQKQYSTADVEDYCNTNKIQL